MQFLNQHTSKYQERSKQFVCTRLPGSSMFCTGLQPDQVVWLEYRQHHGDNRQNKNSDAQLLHQLARYPLRGNHQCVICMKYKIIILIIIIISLGQLLLSYFAITHTRTHARTHARTHTLTHTHTPPSPFRLSLFDGSLAPTVAQLMPLFARSLPINGRSLAHSNKQSRGRHGFLEFFWWFRV